MTRPLDVIFCASPDCSPTFAMPYTDQGLALLDQHQRDEHGIEPEPRGAKAALLELADDLDNTSLVGDYAERLREIAEGLT